MEPLSTRVHKNSVVYPTIRVASHPNKLLMGVYADGVGYVEGTVLNRRSGEQGAPIPRELFPVVIDSDAPEAIYAGTLYFHFGHFLLESLARAWYAHEHPDLPFVWAGAHTWQGFQLKPWQSEILDILGIRNQVMIIADPTRFNLLHVPDIGYRYDDTFHPDHARFLGCYEGPTQIPGQRLWLSRSKLRSDVRDLNAAPTERRLGEAGWLIAHPETLTVREQLDLLSRAEVIAGEEGSAFHTLVLLKHVESKSFHVFRRRGEEHRNMHTIGDARQVKQTFYTLQGEQVLRAKGRVVSKISPSSSEILDILEVPVPVAEVPASGSAEDRIVQTALKRLAPRRFLDVGARDPFLIIAASAKKRVAVSPRFDFDPRSFSGRGVRFYDLDLEQYADVFHGDQPAFDVIRITGSDLQEVMTSFRVSKRLAKEQTTWILGCGEIAARAALAIQIAHPGYAAKRLVLQRRFIFIARRVPGEPKKEEGVARLSSREVSRRNRWLPLELSRLRKHKGDAQRSA